MKWVQPLVGFVVHVFSNENAQGVLNTTRLTLSLLAGLQSYGWWSVFRELKQERISVGAQFLDQTFLYYQKLVSKLQRISN